MAGELLASLRKAGIADAENLHAELLGFREFGRETLSESRQVDGLSVPVYLNEFWTAKQRDGHSLHEVSYRACYKPQLPEFFIRRFCDSGDVVYDPFMGRGTTLLEAQMLGCASWGNDINPLSKILAGPRLKPPMLSDIERRLREVRLPEESVETEDLLVFFEEKTLREILGWRAYFRQRKSAGEYDAVDSWIQMVATNRLTGHSPGFFSVYTLPPNQATSVVAQRKINEKRNQKPTYRDTRAILFKKSRLLLKDPLSADYGSQDVLMTTGSADATPKIPDRSVKLIVTSPPFVDAVDYIGDNWLRMWFCEVELRKADLWQLRKVEDWKARMASTFRELARVLRPDGWIAFEVGEVRKGRLLLEDVVIQAARPAGLDVECVMINSQVFTKTANCWGVDNNSKGTNSNRIVILRHKNR
jgi:hypothetical protein